MIRNLLSNAVKYTSKGKILLGCRRRGDKLRIEVWDTGIGIPEEQLPAIFEEFHQLDNPARERSKGLGLGLAIVERLADLLGHAVDVRSRPGKGSVFAVEVPLVQRRAAVAASTRPGRGKRKCAAERRHPGRRGRAVGTRDAGTRARRRGSPHDRRRGREKGAGIGGARRDTSGPRPRRLQSAERSERPAGRRRSAGDARSRGPGHHPDRRHLDRRLARDRPRRPPAPEQAGERAGADRPDPALPRRLAPAGAGERKAARRSGRR